MSLTSATSGIAMSRGGLVFRPATLDDAAFAADYRTALYPDEPEDPVLMRHSWASADPEWVVERFVVLDSGRPIGLAVQAHAPWSKMPERFGRVDGDLLPDARQKSRLETMYDFVEERSRAEGTRTFNSWVPETDRFKVEFLVARGFREERRERFWELDLVANRERLLAMTEASRAKMRDGGVAIETLAEVSDSEKYRKLWRMSEEAEQDVPTTVPHVSTPFDTFMKWMASPGLREDRIWVARVADDVVGVSMLSYPPVRGVVQTDWTATARSVRGRGVARALKCETVTQAIGLGVPRVRTDNDGENAPILHINETMGYVRRPDWIQLLKPAS